MKQTLLTFIIALLAATGAWAQTTFIADNLKYTVTDETTHTVELTGYVTAPEGALTIPATVTNEDTEYSVTSIGKSAFRECNGITEVTIPDGVTSIEYCAFNQCDKITLVTFGNGLKTIGQSAFHGCKALREITIPDGVTSIGYMAFNVCRALTKVTIPASVTTIEGLAFHSCSALTAINVDEANADYCSDGGVLFNKSKTTLIQYPIGKTETTYTIPDDVTSVGDYAFEDCKALTSVTLPEGLTSIGNHAFGGCSALTTITLPASLTSLGSYSFGISSLMRITSLATTPPTMIGNPFIYVSRTIPVYVPAASLATYQAADVWSEFNLQAISTTGLQTPAMPESIRMQGGTLHNPQGLHLTLYDMQGRQVYSGTDATVSQPAGVYVVRCAGASGKVVF